MQQAQANRDLICLRLAIVEQAAIDSLATPQPIIPKTSKKPNNTKQTSNGADVLSKFLLFVYLIYLIGLPFYNEDLATKQKCFGRERARGDRKKRPLEGSTKHLWRSKLGVYCCMFEYISYTEETR